MINKYILLLIIYKYVRRRGKRRLQLRMLWKKKHGRWIRRRRTVQRLWFHLQTMKMKMSLVFTKLSINVRLSIFFCLQFWFCDFSAYLISLINVFEFVYSSWETTKSSFSLQLLHQVRNQSNTLSSYIVSFLRLSYNF